MISSVAVGAFIAFGAFAAAFVGILLLASVLEFMSERRSRAADSVFTAVLMLLAFAVPIFGTAGGAGEFFSAFSADYGYDITFALYDEIMRSLPWLIIGVLAVSPLRRALGADVRRGMRESEKFYGAARIAETVICALLIVLATAAASV